MKKEDLDVFRAKIAEIEKKLAEDRDALREVIDEAETLLESIESGLNSLGLAKMHLDEAADELSKYV